MALENKLGITNSAELAREEERISKKKAVELFESGALDKLAPGGNIINTNEIQNYPGVGFINGAELAIQIFDQVQKIGAEFDYRTVTSIRDLGDVKEIHCEEDDKVYTARAVIIATGTQPNHLHCQGEDQFTGNGISWCAICDGASYRDKDVVVIGGGNSAVEESIYLAGRSAAPIGAAECTRRAQSASQTLPPPGGK